jgi:hypothetical protein
MSTEQGKTTGPASTGSKSTHELRTDATAARAQLAVTLDAIEYKLNVPRRLRDQERLARRRLHKLGEENPTALLGVALGSALFVGAAIWFALRPFLDD